jgi:hypothetical protein
MSTKKFVVYSPGHTIQVYKLPVDISAASALGQIAPLFGNLANKSVLYKVNVLPISQPIVFLMKISRRA